MKLVLLEVRTVLAVVDQVGFGCPSCGQHILEKLSLQIQVRLGLFYAVSLSDYPRIKFQADPLVELEIIEILLLGLFLFGYHKMDTAVQSNPHVFNVELLSCNLFRLRIFAEDLLEQDWCLCVDFHLFMIKASNQSRSVQDVHVTTVINSHLMHQPNQQWQLRKSQVVIENKQFAVTECVDVLRRQAQGVNDALKSIVADRFSIHRRFHCMKDRSALKLRQIQVELPEFIDASRGQGQRSQRKAFIQSQAQLCLNLVYRFGITINRHFLIPDHQGWSNVFSIIFVNSIFLIMNFSVACGRIKRRMKPIRPVSFNRLLLNWVFQIHHPDWCWWNIHYFKASFQIFTLICSKNFQLQLTNLTRILSTKHFCHQSFHFFRSDFLSELLRIKLVHIYVSFEHVDHQNISCLVPFQILNDFKRRILSIGKQQRSRLSQLPNTNDSTGVPHSHNIDSLLPLPKYLGIELHSTDGSNVPTEHFFTLEVSHSRQADCQWYLTVIKRGNNQAFKVRRPVQGSQFLYSGDRTIHTGLWMKRNFPKLMAVQTAVDFQDIVPEQDEKILPEWVIFESTYFGFQGYLLQTTLNKAIFLFYSADLDCVIPT